MIQKCALHEKLLAPPTMKRSTPFVLISAYPFSEFKNLSSLWPDMAREERIKQLHRLLKGRFLRRVKRDVVRDLPEKIEIVVPLDLTPAQKYVPSLRLL